MASAEGQEPVERDLLCWDMVWSVSLLAHQPDFLPGSCLQFLVARSNLGIFLLLRSECLQFRMPILAMLSASVSVHMPYEY